MLGEKQRVLGTRPESDCSINSAAACVALRTQFVCDLLRSAFFFKKLALYSRSHVARIRAFGWDFLISLKDRGLNEELRLKRSARSATVLRFGRAAKFSDRPPACLCVGKDARWIAAGDPHARKKCQHSRGTSAERIVRLATRRFGQLALTENFLLTRVVPL